MIGATDADGDIASYAVKPGASPAKGNVSFSGDSFVYTPFGNFNGSDSFTIVVKDSNGNTVEQVVSVTITPLPDAPVASDDAVSATGGLAKQIPVSDLLANDFDLDGDPISLTTVGNATGGTVSLSGGTVTFTPAAGFNGAGGFDYTIASADGSDTAHVTVSVRATPAAVAAGKTFTGHRAGRSSQGRGRACRHPVLRHRSQWRHAQLSAAGAAHGSVTGGAGGLFTYQPTAGFAGSDSFTVTVSDGKGGTATRSVAITVINLPDTIDWTIVAPTGHVSEIGGSGSFIGTNGFQKVTVLDQPGLITFDSSMATASLAGLFVPAGTQTYGPVPGGAGSLVTGTNAAERISLAADANVVLDASFVRGNDTLVILGNSTGFAIASSVAGLAITSAAGAHIRIPAFVQGGGLTLQFDDATFQLSTTDGVTFRLGSQTIGASPGMIGSGLPVTGTSTGALVYRGGDLVDVAGDADEWCVAVLDGKVLLTDGDTHLLLAVGASGVLLAFDDGLRTLAFDPHTRSYMVGTQAFDDDLASITAPPQSLDLPAGGNPAAQAQLLLEAGAVVSAGGKFHVEGTASAEFVTVLHGDFEFGSSFASGGDSIGFNFAAPTYTAVRQGDAVLLDGTDTSALLPGPAVVTTLDFDGQVRNFLLDAGTMTIGTQIITTTESPLTFA